MSPLSHAGDGTFESVLTITCQGATIDHPGTVVDCQGADVDHPSATDTHQNAVFDHLGVAGIHQGAAGDCQGVSDLAALRTKRLSLRDVLIMEAINLDLRIFMPAPWWVPTITFYDNDFE
jgi:hypothetical protein